MAVRTPVFFNGADIQQMNTAQIDAIKRQAKFKYSESPSVTLTYASGSGSLGTINDTRQQSGSTLTNASAFPDASLGSQITVANAHIDENKDTNMYSVVDSNNIKFPCFLDGSNNIQPMSDSDFIDTFIKPALASYNTTNTDEDSFGGIFHIQTGTSFSGSTIVNSNPVFIDTRNDGNTSGVNQTTDQPETVQNYYLYQKDGADNDYTVPLHVLNTGGDAFTPDSATFGEVLQNMMKYCAVFIDSCKIDYAYSSGTQRGVSITNTELNSSSQSNVQINADDYRSQEHPAGTATTVNTYFLGITVT